MKSNALKIGICCLSIVAVVGTMFAIFHNNKKNRIVTEEGSAEEFLMTYENNLQHALDVDVENKHVQIGNHNGETLYAFKEFSYRTFIKEYETFATRKVMETELGLREFYSDNHFLGFKMTEDFMKKQRIFTTDNIKRIYELSDTNGIDFNGVQEIDNYDEIKGYAVEFEYKENKRLYQYIAMYVVGKTEDTYKILALNFSKDGEILQKIRPHYINTVEIDEYTPITSEKGNINDRGAVEAIVEDTNYRGSVPYSLQNFEENAKRMGNVTSEMEGE